MIAREQGDDPIGSAWAVERMLVVELPLPWPEDFTEARAFPSGLATILTTFWEEHSETGLLAIAPDRHYSREGWTRIIDFRFPPPPRARAARAEYLAPDEQVGPILAALLTDDTRPLPHSGVERVDYAGRDLLICTHGTVDACCALFGYPLYREMRRAAGESASAVRVWRSTHFGGHRFAPTLLDFPEGRFWGFLDPTEGAALVQRTAAAADLRERYRGWAGYEDPRAQVLEREALVGEGWEWTTWPQLCEVLEQDEQGSMLMRLTAFPDDGTSIAYEGLVEMAGMAAVLHATDGELEEEPRYRVRDVRRSVISRNAPSDAPHPLPPLPAHWERGQGVRGV